MRQHSTGFTIVETIIVLAVSSVMFVSVSLAFRSTLANRQFVQSVDDAVATLQDYANNTTAGYFGIKNQGQNCVYASATLSSGGPAGSGNCIFVGYEIASPNATSLAFTPLFSSKDAAGGGVADSIASLQPIKKINPAGSLTTTYQFKNGLTTVAAFTAINNNYFVSTMPPASTSQNDSLIKGYSCTNYSSNCSLVPITSEQKICLTDGTRFVKITLPNGSNDSIEKSDTGGSGVC